MALTPSKQAAKTADENTIKNSSLYEICGSIKS